MGKLTVIGESLMVATAAAGLAHQLGLRLDVSLLIGVVAGLAAWRPPPARSIPQPSVTTANPSGPGLDLGRVVSAPRPAASLQRQRLWLRLADLDRHATVVGATGSGKTTTLARLMDSALDAGWPVLVVDAKGGRLANTCLQLGARHALEARIWLPEHSASWTYDVCSGSPTAVANRLVGAFEHGREGQVYRNLSQALVPLAVRSLHEAGLVCNLDSLRFSLDRAHLTGLARRTPDPVVKSELIAMLEDELHKQALAGLTGRLRSLRYGVFGRWLLPSDATLDPTASLSQPGITYFGLPATAASEDVALVGRALIQHLKQAAYTALWAEPQRPALLVLDEFASLGEAVQLVDLLLQAREARLAVVVSTQHLPREHALRSGLLGSGVLIVHQVGSASEARELSETLGTRTGAELVRHIQMGPAGPLARRLVRPRLGYLVDPDNLSHLPTGQVAVAVRFGEQRLALVQVEPLSV